MKKHEHILLRAVGDKYYCIGCKGRFEERNKINRKSWMIGIPMISLATAVIVANSVELSFLEIGVVVAILLFLWIAVSSKKTILPVK